MGCDHNLLGSRVGELEGKRIQSDDSFVVEMLPLSLLIDKQMNVNSTNGRNFSRKGSIRVGDSVPTANQRDTAAALHGDSTPRKAAIVAADDSPASLLHHQISITDGIVSNMAAVESKIPAKAFSFRGRSVHSLSINPIRMFLFFATMSSLGTMLLIYLTFTSTSKLNGDRK